MPSQVTTSFWLWIAGFIAGLAAAAVAASGFDDLAPELAGRIREQITVNQLTIAPSQVGPLADGILLITLATVAVLVVLQLVLVGLMRGRRGWARVLLVLTVVPSVPAILVAQDLVTFRTQLGFLLQGALMILGSILMFLPDSNAWFRARPRV